MAVRALLLDSHVLLWVLARSSKLSQAALRALDAADTHFVSAATIYELDHKRHAGGLRPDRMIARLPADLQAELPTFGYDLLPVTVSVAARAAALAMPHPDPWDRILVAQAQELGAALVTADSRLHEQATDITLIW